MKYSHKGEKNPASKLHNIHVQIIRMYREQWGWSYDKITEEMSLRHDVDISPQQVGFICRRQKWKHLPQPMRYHILREMDAQAT